MNSNEYPFRKNFFEIGAHKMHYVDEGNGPVLVFLHGNPSWSYYWRNLLKVLNRDYRVIAPDHLGCGLSDKPQKYDYCLKNHTLNIVALLDSLKVKDVTLLLHDWGGAIGMGYAVARPKHVSRFVLFNTAAFTSDEIPLGLSLCRVPFLGKFMIQRLNAFAVGATWLATAKGLNKAIRKEYVMPYDSFKNRIATFRFVQDIPMTPKHPTWNVLKGIESNLEQFKSHPMALYWGGKDWVFHTGFLKEWEKRFPQAESQLFPEAGHYVVEDAKEEILPLLKDFLNRTQKCQTTSANI